MSKKKITSNEPDKIETVEHALSRSEQFIEKNQKLLVIAVAALVLIVGGYILYNKFILQPKNDEANSLMFGAEQYFERDSFKLALNGLEGGNYGFLKIIDEYSSTKAGNLAQYYAGICYLHLGQFNEAIKCLEDFDSDDKILKPEALGATGDAYLELKQEKKAVEYYLKAGKRSDNEFTAPLYLMRAGLVLEMMKDYKGALVQYNLIKEKYRNSNEGRVIDKYIAKAEILAK